MKLTARTATVQLAQPRPETKADAARSQGKTPTKVATANEKPVKTDMKPSKQLLEIEQIEAKAAKDMLKATKVEPKSKAGPKSKAAQGQSIEAKKISQL